MNRYPKFLNRRLLSKAKDCDALIVTGDITTGLHTEEHLKELGKFCKNVYFVLGNHDFYTSSFQETMVKTRAACLDTNVNWLDDSDPVELSPGNWLLGVDGWYDGVQGDLLFMDVNFDRMMIKDLLIKRRREERAEVIVDRAMASAKNFKEKMAKIPSSAKRILVATHYPPWMGPIRSILDAFWLPQSVNSSLADEILLEAGARGPETAFEVICGHVHKTYAVQPAENVQCVVLDSRTVQYVDVR